MHRTAYYILILSIVMIGACSSSLTSDEIMVSDIGPGWAKTSVNAPIFRKNSVVSAGGSQFVAYYDSAANVVLAKRSHGTDEWEIYTTQYKGNVYDAHNVISIMVDGNGYLHMGWDHHNNPLNYCKSVEPYSCELGEKEPMTGENENVVSYPEFYKFSNGDLLFAYRDGGSGNGNLVLNRYRISTGKWERVQTNLIDGEGQRNAYWQIHIDKQDRILVSWVWRETPDVASNHDMCFACSDDGGLSWEKSNGEAYNLPINIESAEVVFPIQQNSNLINQTSMTSDDEGNVYIATYYKAMGDSCTQFHLIYSNGEKWAHSTVTNRSFDFNLSGMGSRSVPISRPQIVVLGTEKNKKVHVIYRDEEHNNKVCISSANVNKFDWQLNVLNTQSIGRWEPSFDTELWLKEQKLYLYLQNVGQGQGETTVKLKPQMVSILEVEMSH
jgi:hypothetical protein